MAELRQRAPVTLRGKELKRFIAMHLEIWGGDSKVQFAGVVAIRITKGEDGRGLICEPQRLESVNSEA